MSGVWCDLVADRGVERVDVGAPRADARRVDANDLVRAGARDAGAREQVAELACRAHRLWWPRVCRVRWGRGPVSAATGVGDGRRCGEAMRHHSAMLDRDALDWQREA